VRLSQDIEPEERDLAMRLSALYIEKIQAAQEIGEAKGRQEGRQEGRAEEGRTLILRQLARRLGSLPPELENRVRDLPLAALEDLGEALLDFAQVGDLLTWLDR
jgi:predicted transposase YdaD